MRAMDVGKEEVGTACGRISFLWTNRGHTKESVQGGLGISKKFRALSDAPNQPSRLICLSLRICQGLSATLATHIQFHIIFFYNLTIGVTSVVPDQDMGI